MDNLQLAALIASVVIPAALAMVFLGYLLGRSHEQQIRERTPPILDAVWYIGDDPERY